MSLQTQRLNMRNRQLAELAETKNYKEALKPFLLARKKLVTDSIKEPNSEFEAVKQSIELVNTNKIISSIVSLIEGAGERIKIN